MYDGMCIRLVPGLLRLLWGLWRKLYWLQRVLWLRLRLFRGMRGRLRCNLRHHLQRHLLWELPGPVLWDGRGGGFRLIHFYNTKGLDSYERNHFGKKQGNGSPGSAGV